MDDYHPLALGIKRSSGLTKTLYKSVLRRIAFSSVARHDGRCDEVVCPIEGSILQPLGTIFIYPHSAIITTTTARLLSHSLHNNAFIIADLKYELLIRRCQLDRTIVVACQSLQIWVTVPEFTRVLAEV